MHATLRSTECSTVGGRILVHRWHGVLMSGKMTAISTWFGLCRRQMVLDSPTW